jgi:hypothetical protein
MKYIVRRRTFDNPGDVDISREQFDDAKTARKGLLEALSIEEKFDILSENYFEFERDLLEITLRNSMFSGRDWSSSKGEIHLIDRRIINLLTTSRLYLDQLLHHVSSIYGKASSEMASLENKISAEYDSTFGYRVLDAMRNFVQHRDLPVFLLQLGASRKDSPTKSKRTITPNLNVGRLKEDKRFKHSIIKELETLGEDIDLKPIVRESMEAFGRIHLFVRESWANDVARWDESILGIRKSYQDRFGEMDSSLSLVAIDDSGSTTESISIFEDLIKRRKLLIEKNRTITRYNSEVITSESA